MVGSYAALIYVEQQDLKSLSGDVLDIYLNESVMWAGIPVEAWEYNIGGYQVLRKWLSYREHGDGRTPGLLWPPLTTEETRYFTSIVCRSRRSSLCRRSSIAIINLSGDSFVVTSEFSSSGQVDRARVLVVVKASPEIGRSHGETVCVAGVRTDSATPHWVRLFPVQWEWFWGKPHPKYQLLDVEITKHDKDPRPESYRPKLETAIAVATLKKAGERAEVLNQLPQPTMCELVAAKGWQRTSLALVVPDEVLDFDWEDNRGSSDHVKKMQMAAQGSLLSQGAPKLEFSPYTFRFRYRCRAAECKGESPSKCRRLGAL